MIALTGSHWQTLAVCRRETPDAPEIWTPPRRPARPARLAMEQMCHRCPVKRVCAAEAVTSGAQTGMYAGVYVPQASSEASWVKAMKELAEIAGVNPVLHAAEDDLGVPA